MIDCLHWYAKNGWPIFPVSAKTKTPFAGTNGFKDATTDQRQIDAWYKECPNCAWAVATSAERSVIDIDPRNGGDASLARLMAEHGPMPDTPKVKTGGGGWHYWFHFPPGTKCGVVAEGIDRKAECGYVIVPPSVIAIPEHQGRAYAWEVRPWEATIAEAPAWLLTAKAKSA